MIAFSTIVLAYALAVSATKSLTVKVAGVYPVCLPVDESEDCVIL